MRVSAPLLIAIGAIAVLVAIGVTDQVLPATDARTAELRPWIAARALGVMAYLLLALEVATGLVLSHPRNTAAWRKTKQVFPWHELLTVFTFGFLAIHGVLLAVDRFANVGWLGALVPGLSAYRTPAIALGTVAAYTMLFTAITAKWTRLLPSGWWLKVHRVAALTFLMAWLHAVLSGTDGGALLPLYIITGVPILAGVVHRSWTARARPQRAAAPAASRPMSIGRPAPAAASTEES
jgi:DMSO/TMAO reductase YedYZ heme-binding membrane subunit